MHGRVLPAMLLKSLLGRCVHWSHPHAFLWHKILCVKDTDPNASLICHARRGALYDARRKRRFHDSLVGSAILVRFSSFGHLIKSLPPNSARTFQSHLKCCFCMDVLEVTFAHVLRSFCLPFMETFYKLPGKFDANIARLFVTTRILMNRKV